MIKWNKSLVFKFLAGILITAGVTSCQLFENDVADFMEKYTETAAIETHEFNVQTYDDALSQLCISSEEDTQISLYMRNPKQFTLIPSVTFPQLSSGISTATVAINQTDKQTIMLSLPQSFLVPADEGNNITAEIRLYEPMSGRDFDRYKVNLHCNTIPPQILNPTIMNDNGYFVICFDMPNREDVALRHTDISEIVINGASYPVVIPAPEEDTTSDISGVMTVNYDSTVFPNSQFTKFILSPATTATCGFSVLGGKTFTPNKDSWYFATGEPLIAGDKEYTIELKDSAGLTATSLASTSISKLNKPVIRSVDPVSGIQTELSGDGIIGVPYDEDSEKGIITITPPSTDHHGHAVYGSTVHYRIYEATGTGRIYTSGTATTTKTIELPQNTYRVEAYATLTNYEQSSTESIKIRLMNNVIYVKAATSADDVRFADGAEPPDGSATAPFTTVQLAIDDINTRTGEQRKPNYTIYIDGDFTTTTFRNRTTSNTYGSLTITTVETDKLAFRKWPGASEAKLLSMNMVASGLEKVIFGDITFTGGSNTLLKLVGSTAYEINGTIITGSDGNGQKGIDLSSAQNVVIQSCSISHCVIGIFVNENSSLVINGGSITGTSTGNVGIQMAGTVTINNCIVTGYSGSGAAGGIRMAGTAPVLNLYGGTITGNKIGIARNTGTINAHGNPVVTGNQSSGANPVVTNINLGDGSITIDGPLTTGCNIGVRKDTGGELHIGDTPRTFTTDFRVYNPAAMPSSFFTSDAGLSVVLSEDEAGLVVAGASGQDMYGASDYTFTLAATDVESVSNTLIYPNAVKKLKITPTITRTGGTDIYYNYADHKLYTDSGFTTVAANGNTVTWTAEVLNGGVKAFDVPASGITDVSGGVQISFTAPANPGDYSLKVHANFLGMPHNHSFPLTLAEALTGVNVNGTHYNGSTMAISDSSVFIAGREFDIPNLWVCDHETTQKEYIFDANPSMFKSNPVTGEVQENRPVEKVSWYHVLVYCNKRSILEGLTPCYTISGSTNPADWGTIPTSNTNSAWNGVTCNFNANGYRMPVEAEWEYLARNADLTGSQNTYHGTSDVSEIGNYAWYLENASSKTHEVKLKLPNALGLYDMGGNVYEWCWDYINSTTEDLTGIGYTGTTLAAIPDKRVMRGGGISSSSSGLKVFDRGKSDSNAYPSSRNEGKGFRLVRTRQ